MMRSRFWLSTICSLVLCLNIAQVLHGEINATFSDCYSDTLIGLMFIAKLDSNDEQVKNFVTNMCNFYHEKTGLWMTHENWFNEELKQKYAQEFYQKYKSSFPDELLKLVK